MHRIHEIVVSDEFLGQEWIEDERIWAELGLRRAMEEFEVGAHKALRDDMGTGNKDRKRRGKEEEKGRRDEGAGEWVMV